MCSQGKLQGPFSWDAIHGWAKKGYLPGDLMLEHDIVHCCVPLQLALSACHAEEQRVEGENWALHEGRPARRKQPSLLFLS